MNKVVIMAGGRGTRISNVNREVPKPMIPIGGIPILEYQIEVLHKQGFVDMVLVVGYLGDVIKNYFGDGNGISVATGKAFGVSIDYIEEKKPLGTAGALGYLKNVLDEDFLLLNGDIIFDIDIGRLFQYHRSKKGAATIFTHPNGHPYDSGIIIANEEKRVTDWLHKEDRRVWYRNRVNAGIHILSPKVLQLSVFNKVCKLDLDRDILKKLIPEQQLFVYDSPEYVKDMGTPERYKEVVEDVQSGRVAARNLLRRQKAIFLDRDGTLNRYVGFLRDIDELELLEGVAEAVRMINRSEYLAIIVTNQPVIARGEVTKKELELIHQKLETLLGEEGAYLDAIYYCPHHPDKGFEGEIPELKIECSCRKPKPGMLLQAAADFNIDLKESWMIGDGEADVEAGKAAGCRTVKLPGTKGEPGEYRNLLAAIMNIL